MANDKGHSVEVGITGEPQDVNALLRLFMIHVGSQIIRADIQRVVDDSESLRTVMIEVSW